MMMQSIMKGFLINSFTIIRNQPFIFIIDLINKSFNISFFFFRNCLQSRNRNTFKFHR